ncbi:MAG: SURF1 family protein [Casimicrobium sp.]
MNATSNTARRFRPRWWAAALTLVFAAVTIHLGNWQATRAEYKIEQQRLLDEALAAPPKNFVELANDKNNDRGIAFRYRSVNLSAEFDVEKLFFVDNKIQDGKAGYGVLQLMRASAGEAKKYVLIDRGWIAANNDRSKLPQLETPKGIVEIVGRVNLPVSRNPGTADNNADDARINYVNIDELAKRLGMTLEPYVIEQTQGAGFLNTPRAAPAANYQKNRAYQMQWYAFAALAVVLFLVLSFRKEQS